MLGRKRRKWYTISGEIRDDFPEWFIHELVFER